MLQRFKNTRAYRLYRDSATYTQIRRRGKALKRALKLKPSYAQGHFYYGYYLAQQGRLQEAIREMGDAYRLDPLVPRRATNLAWTYYFARRFDEAIAQYRKILELDPRSATAHYSLGMAYEQTRRFDAAAAEVLKSSTVGAEPPAWLANLAHADGGWGYGPGQSIRLEPSCLALLALAQDDAFKDVVDRGLQAVRQGRTPDGAYRLPGDRDEAVWPTALVLFLHAQLCPADPETQRSQGTR